MLQRIFVLLLLGVFCISPVRAEDEKDPQGAVLCTWSKYVELFAYGTTCGFDANAGLQPLLSESIARMDRFITDNSSITQPQLEDKKNTILQHQRDEASKAAPQDLAQACSGDASSIIGSAYKRLLSTDPAMVRQQISKLLSVPRKPVMEPCS